VGGASGCFGCEYCADRANRSFGHVTQIGTHPTESRLLLRCPRCSALYDYNTVTESTIRLDEDEARRVYPDAL
jgi:hypothetical protein